MIKNLFILAFLALSVPVFAQDYMSAITKEQQALTDPDKFIELLLEVPYEKRQYVFPAVHEEPLIAHKIKSHPEIIVWKNKSPTVIAPQLKDFAKEHLPYLSATLYPYVDPDMWDNAKDAPVNINAISTELYPLPAIKKSNYMYPSLGKMYQQQALTKSTLSAQDVAHVANFTTYLDEFGKTLDNEMYLQKELVHVQGQRTNNFLADPFTLLLDNLKQNNHLAQFKAFLHTKGIKNVDEFMKKADIILKAYRTEKSLNLMMALTFNKVRKEFPIQKGQKISSVQMYAKLYEVNPNDVYFVQDYMDELAPAFDTKKREKFSFWGMPIYID